MTETLLALVPVYGLFLIGMVVTISCLAVPLPASMLVMASGGFAAAGDLVLWQVVGVAFAAYVIGDQLAFGIARWGGPRVSDRLKARPRRAALVERAEALVKRWGAAAVLASRTIVSPLGPTVSYICGAAGLNRLDFTLASVLGAALWSSGYALLGYGFAERIDDIADLLVSETGFVLAVAMALLMAFRLWRSWRAHQRERREVLRHAAE